MKSLKNLIDFNPKVNLSLEDVTGHSQSIVTEHGTLSGHISYINDQSKDIDIPQEAILTDFNKNHIDNDIIFFKFKDIEPDKICQVFKYHNKEFIIPEYVNSLERPNRNNDYEEPRYPPNEWVLAIEKLFNMSEGAIIKASEYSTNLNIFLTNTPRTFSEFIDVLVSAGVFKSTNSNMCFFDRLHGQELEYFNYLLVNPNKFITNIKLIQLIQNPEKGVEDLIKKRTISDDYLKTLKNKSYSHSRITQKNTIRRLLESHEYKGNENEMVLAMYYICVGLDDYAIKNLFDYINDTLLVYSFKKNNVWWKVDMLLMQLNYNDNSGTYQYGKNSKKHSDEYLANSPFEKSDLIIPKFEVCKINKVKLELDRMFDNSKFDLASFNIEYKEIV